jgi:hypothetical protein
LKHPDILTVVAALVMAITVVASLVVGGLQASDVILTVGAAVAEHLPAEARVVGRVQSAVALPASYVDIRLQVDAGLGAVRQIAGPPAVLSLPA